MDAKQRLATSIATQKEQLRRMEERLREKERAERLAAYVRVGKIVETVGLLTYDAAFLTRVLQVGLEGCFVEDQVAATERAADQDGYPRKGTA